jgi:SNF2 family DNA or RNA helicase
VFAYFRAVCAGIEAIGKALGLRVVSIKGSDDDAKRQEAIDTFQAGHADMFVAPIKAAGVGITLHRASDLLFVERHWVTKELEQAEDRAHRLGQTMPVTVTYLDAADTIDENIARVNASKTVLIDALVDDKRTDGADFAAADEVIRSYVGGKP